MSTSDYEPRFLEIWKDGATRKVAIPVDSVNAAVSLRQRLYRMRQEMKREGHPLYQTAKRGGISIQIKYTNNTILLFSNKKVTPVNETLVDKVELVIQPQDNAFDDALEAAGYKLVAPPSLD